MELRPRRSFKYRNLTSDINGRDSHRRILRHTNINQELSSRSLQPNCTEASSIGWPCSKYCFLNQKRPKQREIICEQFCWYLNQQDKKLDKSYLLKQSLMMRCVLMTILSCLRTLTRTVHAKHKMNNHTNESNHKQQRNRNQYELNLCQKWQWHSKHCTRNRASNQIRERLLNHLVNIKIAMNRPINTALLWTAPEWSQLIYNWVFMFNDWNLDNGSNIRVIASNHDDIWAIDFNTYKTPLEDWWWVLWKYYRTKTIQIVLSIKADSENSLNDLIDEVKYRTAQTEWDLRIIINNVVRERKATCTALKFNRQSYNVNRCWNVILTFNCVQPHSHLLDPNAVSFISQTWVYQTVITYDWRADTYPTVRITMESSSTWFWISLNWYEITIDSELSSWDSITFDWEKKTVKVNDVEVEYTWPFTPLTYWDNVFEVWISWATYTWALSYYTRFL